MESILPFKNEFLLSLVNNNYSDRTLENYARDLLVFDLFLQRYHIDFKAITKLKIDEYKGYLKTGQHHIDLDKIKEINQEKPIETKTNANILETALNSELLRKSRQKHSKNNRRMQDGLNSRSINRMLSSIRSYLKFLIDIDKDVPISAESIKLVKTLKGDSQVAEFVELVKLIEAPDSFEIKQNIKFRNRAILEMFFSTGLRISELVYLNLDDLNFNKQDKKILDNKIFIIGKGKKRRYVYLTQRCISYLERYLGIRDDCFPALFIPYRGQRVNHEDLDDIRISQRFIQSMIKRYSKLLGILVPTTPHSIRHGFATYIAEQGANPAAIQHLLGHESLQTTTRYVHSSDRFAQKSHEQYHPLKKVNV